MEGRRRGGRGGGTGEPDAPEPGDRESGGKVLEFPGNWIGPLEELVPMGSAAKAPAATLSADAFWGEDAQSLHQVIEAPQPASADGEAADRSEAGAAPVRTRSRPGRLLAPVTLILACLAALAFALHVSGVWPGAGPVGRGSRHVSRSTGHGVKEPALIKPQWVRLRTGPSRQPATHKPAVKPHAAKAPASVAVSRTTPAVETVTVAPVAPADSPGSAGASGSTGATAGGASRGTQEASGASGTPTATGSGGTSAASGSGGTTAANGSSGTTGASGSGGTTAANGSSGTTGASGSGGTTAASGSGGATPAADSGPARAGAGSGDVGAGNGLPGPGGPPAP